MRKQLKEAGAYGWDLLLCVLVVGGIMFGACVIYAIIHGRWPL